tara:strand:- start:3789 stop:4904 length:1116 start_codon:yes stop_codon:yes gene_type:complete
MKKLIFRKFITDTSSFFLLLSLILGVIVWTLQAVNYLDFITEDGHSLKTYFQYTIYNFPKIIHRLIPFVFFVSIFFIILNYDNNNELLIFWSNGISKISFANNLVFFSILLLILQILIGSVISPLSQFKARGFLKNSNIDYFSALIKEGKFINAVDGLTIFIDGKNRDGTFSNIFIDDSSKSNTRMIYANSGILISNNKQKIFRLFNGKVINKEKEKINNFQFEQIDFSLSEFSSSTILVPKIQEVSSRDLFECSIRLFQTTKPSRFEYFNCNENIKDTINQELLKRFYKPLFLPVIAITCCFLIIIPRNSIKYLKNRKSVFIFSFLLLLVSETSLRYATKSDLTLLVYLFIPWIFFFIAYAYFLKKVRNV